MNTQLQLQMKAFLRFLLARGYTPRTVESYYDCVVVILAGMARRLRKPTLVLKDFTRKRLQCFFDDMMQVRKGRAQGKASVLKHLSALRCFYRFLISRDITTVNVGSLLLAPRLRRHRRPLLHQKDAMAVLRAPLAHKRFARGEAMKGLRDATMISILYEGALRTSELVNLNVGSLHFDSPQQGACLLQFTGKGDKARTVVILKSCKLLRRYLAERRTQGHALAQQDPLFYSFRKGRGGRIARTSLWSLVGKWATAAGVARHVHPHMFRAACATHMFWGGASRRAIQDHLGHENPKMTDWYCHSSPKLVIERGLVCHPLNQARARNARARNPRALVRGRRRPGQKVA